MHTITSEAGTRLARARAAAVDAQSQQMSLSDRYALVIEFEEAAQNVADELMASGFHRMGED
ncbi:MAG: hypothetical protein CME72_11555 [Halomonadaceae bacterium]|nr:hypothetical protein [Halomonadaceae bacterium]